MGHELRLVKAPLRKPRTVQRHRHDPVEPVAIGRARENASHKRRHHPLQDPQIPSVLEGVYELCPYPLVSQKIPRVLESEVSVRTRDTPVNIERRGRPASAAEGLPPKGRASKHHRHRPPLAHLPQPTHHSVSRSCECSKDVCSTGNHLQRTDFDTDGRSYGSASIIVSCPVKLSLRSASPGYKTARKAPTQGHHDLLI
jgi:hypothetical protein